MDNSDNLDKDLVDVTHNPVINKEMKLFCMICSKPFNNKSAHTTHMHREHPLEPCSCCWCLTCNKKFSSKEKLEYHYLTPAHIINSHKCMEDEETLHRKANSPWKVLNPSARYYAYLTEVDNPTPAPRQHPKPRDLLRKHPVNIPLESQEKLPDPRLEPPIKFITLPGVTIGPEPEETTPADDFEVTDETVDIIKQLADTIAEGLKDSSPTETTENCEIPPASQPAEEDIVYLSLDDWLTIDSEGITPQPEDLLPPQEAIDFLDLN